MSGKDSAVEELSRFRMLMTAALDDELPQDQRKEFDALLNSSEDYRKEWTDHKSIKEATMNLKFSSPPPEVWDTYWGKIYNRIERGIGWIIFSIGAMIVLFYGGYIAVESILIDTNLTWFLKTGILAILAGMCILLVSVIREKFFTHSQDKYKEVQR